MTAIFKSSLQILNPLHTRLKIKSTDLAISWTWLLCEIHLVWDHRLNILLTKFKTKVLNLSLNLGLSPFVKSATELSTWK